MRYVIIILSYQGEWQEQKGKSKKKQMNSTPAKDEQDENILPLSEAAGSDNQNNRETSRSACVSRFLPLL